MSISIEQLQKRVAAQFPDVQQISSSTIRFARKAGAGILFFILLNFFLQQFQYQLFNCNFLRCCIYSYFFP